LQHHKTNPPRKYGLADEARKGACMETQYVDELEAGELAIEFDDQEPQEVIAGRWNALVGEWRSAPVCRPTA